MEISTPAQGPQPASRGRLRRRRDPVGDRRGVSAQAGRRLRAGPRSVRGRVMAEPLTTRLERARSSELALAHEVDRLRAENERLRAALREIAAIRVNDFT